MIEALNIISAGFAVAAILLAAFVWWEWAAPAYRALVTGLKTPSCWLAFGIAVAFSGYGVNLLYWAVFYEMGVHGFDQSAALMLASGGPVNIVTRYLPTIIAAFCHLQAGYMTTGGFRPARLLSLGTLAGVAYVAISAIT